jgi:hypothetical protein
MAAKVQQVEYFYCTVEDQPGEAYKLLSLLTDLGVNLFAFTAVPSGLMHTQFTLFPEDSQKLKSEAKKAALNLNGPIPALLVQGDDELGAVIEVHKILYDASINLAASSAVSDGKGNFACVIYIRTEQFEAAKKALEI